MNFQIFPIFLYIFSYEKCKDNYSIIVIIKIFFSTFPKRNKNFQIFHYSFIFVRIKLFDHLSIKDILLFQDEKKKERRMNFQVFPIFLYTISYE